jgi:hypothetical protein
MASTNSVIFPESMVDFLTNPVDIRFGLMPAKSIAPAACLLIEGNAVTTDQQIEIDLLSESHPPTPSKRLKVEFVMLSSESRSDERKFLRRCRQQKFDKLIGTSELGETSWGQLMNLHLVGSQHFNESFRHWQPKTSSKGVPKHNALILLGIQCSLSSGRSTATRFKVTFRGHGIQISLGYQRSTHKTCARFNQITRIDIHAYQVFSRLLSNCHTTPFTNFELLMPAVRFFEFVSLNIISTSPSLSESLLASLFEVDVELPLLRELADSSKPEILPDSELDDEDVEAMVTFAVADEEGHSSWFDGEPSPSIAFTICLMRAMYL